MKSSGNSVKRLIWVYFWLLILEGAFRKWILPGLSGPLLLVRDPVVLAIYFMALSEGRFPRSPFLPWMGGVAVLCFLTAFAGFGTLKVTLFGLHANFLHLPLVFVMAEYFDAEDVRKIGKWVLIALLPMAFLAVMQFQAGTFGKINVAAGGEIGGQIFAAEGKVRASGTFSFVTGLVSFLALASVYLLYDFLEKGVYPKALALAALPALVLSLGVSGSRAAVIAVTVVVAAGALVCVKRWEKFGAAFLKVLLVYAVYLGLGQLSTFREGVEVQRSRFEGGGGLRTGIIERYVGGYVEAFRALREAPALGYGLGVGTNAGAVLISHIRGFALAEGEWPRVILEIGPVLGMLYLLLRTGIVFYAFLRGWSALEAGQTLSLLLLGMSGLEMLTGQFGQSTSLGFAVFGMGLTLASANLCMRHESSPAPAQAPVKFRGRSRYAETLHGNSGK